jgi:uncharacterized Zn-binding protein involved in type VI secretion
MGKPAARLGDPTAHGGVITVGFPTVLIGGMPAARLGDMHVCPMFTGYVPHVGGPISLGSTGVLIGNMPAARMGDMAVCVGPPSSIIMGCPTVLIGETSPGGGGGGAGAGAGGGGGGDVSAVKAALVSAIIADPGEPVEGEAHTLDASFKDAGGFAVANVHYLLSMPDGSEDEGTLFGVIHKANVDPGSYNIKLSAITSAKWSKKETTVGSDVDMIVETVGIDSGIPVLLMVYIKDSNFADSFLMSIETTLNGTEVKEKFNFTISEEYLKAASKKAQCSRCSMPLFYFKAVIGELTLRSNVLMLTDKLTVELKDNDGKAIGNKKYEVLFPNGERRSGKLDSSGKTEVSKIAPGSADFKVDLNS